jgi:hypothetical protein
MRFVISLTKFRVTVARCMNISYAVGHEGASEYRANSANIDDTATYLVNRREIWICNWLYLTLTNSNYK